MTESKEEGWWEFAKFCTQLSNPKDVDAVFDLFFTPEEKKDLATRYLIIKELLKGQMTQRDMASTLKVSIAKITRGSNSLKRIGEELKAFLKSQMT